MREKYFIGKWTDNKRVKGMDELANLEINWLLVIHL